MRSLNCESTIEGAWYFLRTRVALDDERVDVTPYILVRWINVENIGDHSCNGFTKGSVVTIYQCIFGLALVVHDITKVKHQILNDLAVEIESKRSFVEEYEHGVDILQVVQDQQALVIHYWRLMDYQTNVNYC